MNKHKFVCKNWMPWEDLADLMDEAIEKNLFFVSHYQEIRFLPSDLIDEWNNGRMRWGAKNWDLVSVDAFINENYKNIEKLKKEINQLIEDSNRENENGR